MTDPTIRPRLIDGEPTFGGFDAKLDALLEAAMTAAQGMGFILGEGNSKLIAKSGDECEAAAMALVDYVDGLRRLLSEAREERDAARRECCRTTSAAYASFPKPQDYAASRGWSYLYAPTGTDKCGDAVPCADCLIADVCEPDAPTQGDGEKEGTPCPSK